MSQPYVSPQPARGRPRPSVWGWATGLLLLFLFAAIGTGGYWLGHRSYGADLLDPLWVRAYLDRPLDTSAPSDGFWVAGYYVDYDRTSLDVVRTRSNHMDQVVVFGYGFDPLGNLTGTDQSIVRGLTGPQKRILLFGNLTNGTFNADTAHAILTDKAVQDKAVTAMMTKVNDLAAGGIQIDFENILAKDRDAYTAFLRRLKGELKPGGLTLSIAAAAKTRDSTDGWGGATDYAAVGAIIDQMYIMVYDEHWKGGEPGPVASLPWTEKVVRYATGVMPAQKIVLGIPFYGYEWPSDGKSGGAKAYGSQSMAARVAGFGANVKWDPVAGENVATYKTPSGDRVAWWPDERSLDAKLKLAYQYNLKGVALWRLGFEPDDWWNRMGAFRLNPTK
ncbi:MAG TPA: glycosyl hydrolase family 18 protein [Symbiobacteriaceae bacterium]|jgi:spore germination protein YaaH